MNKNQSIDLKEKIDKRLLVIEESFEILKVAMIYNEYNPHLLRQKDKLNIEKRILKKYWNGNNMDI